LKRVETNKSRLENCNIDITRILDLLSCATLSLVCNDSGVNEMRYLCCHPWPKTKTQSMCNAEMRTVLCPERLEVNREANLSSAIHFGSLSVEFWKLNFRTSLWVCHWNIKLQIKLILEKIMDVPAHDK